MTNNNQWQTIRLKYVASINNETLGEDTDPSLALNYIDIGNVGSSGKFDISKYLFTNAPSRARRVVRKGDIIISTVRTYLQAIASIDEPIENLIASTGFAVIRPKPSVLFQGFGKFVLRETSFLDEIQKRSVGVSYPAINSSDLGNIFVRIPSYKTQLKIANYLDAEILKIEKLIEAKEKLLTFLSEKRQSLINQAVTRGLNPDVKVKDSEIEWIGEIPHHWEIKRLNYLVKKINKEVKNSDFIVAVENIESRTGQLVKSGVSNNYQGTLYAFKKWDIIFNKLRPYLAKVYLTEKEGACVGELLILRSEGQLFPPFLFYRLLSADFISEVDSSTVGTKMPRADWDNFIRHLKIAVPPYQEQEQIVEFITIELKKLTTLISLSQESITLLQEKRTALISSAVTGQIEIEPSDENN